MAHMMNHDGLADPEATNTAAQLGNVSRVLMTQDVIGIE